MTVFSFVMPALPRRSMSVRLGRVLILFAIGVSTFVGVTVAGMVSAQAPAPATEYQSQLSTDTGGQDKSPNINADMTKDRPRGPR